MVSFRRFAYALLNRYLPESAHHVVPQAPSHLQPSARQVAWMMANGVHQVRLDYRRNVGEVVLRSFWLTGEKDGILPAAVRSSVPRDVLRLTCDPNGHVEVYAGPGYATWSRAQFEHLVAGMLDGALHSMAYIEFLKQARTAQA